MVGVSAGLCWILLIVVAVGSGLLDEAESGVWLAFDACAFAGGVGAVIVSARLLRWAIIRSTLRRIVTGATCPRCRHSLRGLPVFNDATGPDDRSRMRVRCPECGKPVRLLKYGYGPEDLAPPHERFLAKDFQVRVRR